MSDRVDRKVQEVAIARYEYRHEAEFAAGFLEDAGVPYRLQVDDPALGISVGVSATIWVLGIDVERAREILEVDHRPISLSGRTTAHRPSGTRRPPAASRRAPTTHRSDGIATAPPLEPRERGIAFLLAAGAWGLGSAIIGAGASQTLGYGTVGAGAILALVGILGRAPGAIRRLLSVLSGNAP